MIINCIKCTLNGKMLQIKYLKHFFVKKELMVKIVKVLLRQLLINLQLFWTLNPLTPLRIIKWIACKYILQAIHFLVKVTVYYKCNLFTHHLHLFFLIFSIKEGREYFSSLSYKKYQMLLKKQFVILGIFMVNFVLFYNL